MEVSSEILDGWLRRIWTDGPDKSGESSCGEWSAGLCRKHRHRACRSRWRSWHWGCGTRPSPGTWRWAGRVASWRWSRRRWRPGARTGACEAGARTRGWARWRGTRRLLPPHRWGPSCASCRGRGGGSPSLLPKLKPWPEWPATCASGESISVRTQMWMK